MYMYNRDIKVQDKKKNGASTFWSKVFNFNYVQETQYMYEFKATR